MTLPTVDFDGRFRTRWMFPRNIRKIYSWKISQILSILNITAENEAWIGNQSIQDTFSKLLSESNLKDDRHIYDIRSGGARTYISQLEMLGMVYKEDGRLLYTIAGSDLMNGNPPLPIIQRMLLRIQYPSPYSAGRNVAIHPAIRVKPFLFFFYVLRESKLNFITQDEMGVLLLYGWNMDSTSKCISKIKSMRDTGKGLISIIDNPDIDLYTPRTTTNTLQERLVNLKDDTNCFKNWLEANMLIVQEETEYGKVFIENPDYSALIDEEIKTIDSFISTESPISFQRSFGAYNKIKDTRTNKPTSIRQDPKRALICSKFYSFCGNNIVSEEVDSFIESLSGFGFSRQEVLDSITPLMATSLDYFASTYFEYSHGGMDKAIAFEKSTTEIFNKCFNLSAYHIGQKKRPDHSIGGYTDILLKADDYYALVDTKASSSYHLSHDDVVKMKHTYIPNYVELVSDKKPLNFVCYVAGGFSGRMDAKLKSLSEDGTIKGASAIQAMELYNVANDRDIKKDSDSIERAFSKNKLLTKDDFK